MSKEAVQAELQQQVGQETLVGDWFTIDQERINTFADATNDHQWIHVDPERARKESPFGDTVAHGFLTLSLLPGLTRAVTDGGPRYPGVKLAVNYGLDKVRFPAPVRVNARVRARQKLLEVSEVTGGLQLRNEVTVEIDGEDKPACVAVSLTRLYF